MMHVAPCSCELHVRIRELEAELDETKRTAEVALRRWTARAEKAEAELAERIEEAKTDNANWAMMLRNSEARVAELERTIRENADASRPASETGPSRHSRRTDTRSPGAQFEAREREAD